MTDPIATAANRAADGPNVGWTRQQIEDALRGLQFGSITLLVQDGVVVQIERTERQRYQRPARSASQRD